MTLLGIPAEWFIFGLMLVAISTLHGQALAVAVMGLCVTLAYKFLLLGAGGGATWLASHLSNELPTLANLLLLLVGFAVLANQFERSAIPDAMPRFLPNNWIGGLILLAIVFCLSFFLDNIAAAIIGGVVARHVYQGSVSIGYLAGIVAASNAGGAGSVLGDTTTTMMWIAGVSPLVVLGALIGACAAFVVFGPLAVLQQHRLSPITENNPVSEQSIDWARGLVVMILVGTVLSVNLVGSSLFPSVLDRIPLHGIVLWLAILATACWRSPNWRVVPNAFKGAVFLVALVATASMMPVERLPLASWKVAFGLGLLSAVFDNIPLTALALKQGGYDWSALAFAVGFGGSMVWFGSSAGVALSNLYPEIRSVGAWLRHGWFVPLAYIVGFFVMLSALGWHPT